MALFDREHRSIEIELGGTKIKCVRGRLGLHLELGESLDEYFKAVGARDSARAWRALTAYLDLATGQPGLGNRASFEELGIAAPQLWALNRLQFFPPFLEDPQEFPEPPWTHQWRRLVVWVHKIATAYGWSRSEILGLSPEEAVIYIQEILIGDQLDREWEYGLSGAGRRYNARTRKSHFEPLLRPPWMIDKKSAEVQIPISSLPQGRVIDLGGSDAPGATETLDKQT